MPTKKVGIGALAGAIVAIAMWGAKAFGGVEVPAEIAVAFVVLVTFAVQYVVKDT